MKRLLFLLAVIPFLVNGQDKVEQMQRQTPVEDIMMTNPEGERRDNASSEAPNRQQSGHPAHYKKLKNNNIFVEWHNLGITDFDLQTNSSVGRRIIAYEDSSISAVWTQGNQDPDFGDRGTGYNYFDGNEMLIEPDNVQRLENVRTGWPNIGTFGSGTDRFEFTLTHIAGDPDEGSGGYAFSENDGIGSTNFNSSLHEAGSGPIWWRTATSGDWLHMIGTYTSSSEGPDPEVQGVTRPTVYYRSNNRGETFMDSAVLLPGYADTAKRKFGVADIYSIDARDSIVAIVIAESARQLTLWKSTDYGETWKMHEVVSTGIEYPRFRTGSWNTDTAEDGSITAKDTLVDDQVSMALDEDGTVHLTYSVVASFRNADQPDIEPGQYSYLRYNNAIHYWNDEMFTLEEELERVDTQYKDSTAYNFRVGGEVQDTVFVSYDTAYEYSYNGQKDSVAIDSPRVVQYSNYNDSSMSPFVGTDTIWPAYYSYTYDGSGNKTDSTYHVDDTLYLDSNQVQVVSGYDSVFTEVQNYEDPVFVADNPTIGSFQEMNVGGGNNPYSSPAATRPTIALGGTDTVYAIFEAMVRNTGSGGQLYDYRDLYLTYSVDNGQTWVEEPINITNTAEINGESAYPSLHRKMVNNQLHLVWQEDELPGQAAGASENSAQQDFTRNYIYYAAIPKSLIFDPNTGIDRASQEEAFDATAYPNPFGDQVNVEFELDQSSEVEYQLYDVTGQVKQRENLGRLNKGINEVQLQTSGLSNGVYFLKLHSDQGTQSLKVIKQ